MNLITYNLIKKIQKEINMDRVEFDNMSKVFNGLFGTHSIIEKISDFELEASTLSDKITSLKSYLNSGILNKTNQDKFVKEIKKCHENLNGIKAEIKSLINGD